MRTSATRLFAVATPRSGGRRFRVDVRGEWLRARKIFKMHEICFYFFHN